MRYQSSSILMPLPRALGRFNARVTNPVLGPMVSVLPGFGRVEHRGRRTGRVYRTPVLAFQHGDRMTFAATYGPETDWIRNIVAAGGGTFVRGRQRWILSEPRLYHDAGRRAVPWPVRPVLRVIAAADFLEVRARPARPPGATDERPVP
jgi:deazaflavin-dependent oxidoreductase (nitroreductase family)